VIAKGTADELKARIGGERLELTVARRSDLSVAMQTLLSYSSGEIQVDSEHRHLVIPVTNGPQLLAAVVRDLDAAEIPLDDLALRRPTLDDVFLTLTGREALEEETSAETPTTQPLVRSTR
jgi:ABC-2 type transport system ATP-binding protein